MKANLVFAVCALLAPACPALAATFALNPASDAFVSSRTAQNALGTAAIKDSNYGAAGALAVSAAGLPKGEFDSLLKFDFAPAKASFDLTLGTGQWAVTAITLQLTAQPPNNAIFNGSGTTPANTAGNFVMSWMQNNSWVEGGGTPSSPTTTGIKFSTLSSFLGPSDQALGTFAFGGATSGNTIYTLGLASSFVADVAQGNLSSVLLAPAEAVVALVVTSGNFGATGNASRPLLTLTASPVPEPGSAMLLAGGMCAWLARRRPRDARAA